MKKIFRLLRYLFIGIIVIILLLGSEINFSFHYNISKVKTTIIDKVKNVISTVNTVKTVADFVR